MDLKKEEWEESYSNKDNFVFYPHEEVIRFVSKYIKKRTGIEDFEQIKDMKKGLSLGCGIGRHVLFLDDMNFDAYGIDLSKEAIDFAKKWFKYLGKEYLLDKFIVGSITDMPYKSKKFDFIVSHGVLDSMSFKIAKKAILEASRVLKKNGLFYFDLVSNQKAIGKEEIVTSKHEEGTIQSYFNKPKINKLIGEHFEIKEMVLVTREEIIRGRQSYRYHIIVEKL